MEMKQWFWKIAVGSLGVLAAQPVQANLDSMGVKVVNGKTHVLHQVDAGETLSGLSVRYGSSVSTIRKVNGLNSESVRIGQILEIPSRKAKASISLKDMTAEPAPVKRQPVAVNKTSAAQGPVKHVVQKGETLFAISRKYSVPVGKIKEWNNMSGDGIRIGQTLIVSAPAGVTQAPVVKTPPKEKPTPPKVKPVEVKPVVGQEIINAAPEPPLDKPTRLPDGQPEVVHTVKSGETLFGIARKYGVEASAIRRLNKMSGTGIQIGQRLLIVEAAPLPQEVEIPNPNQAKELQEMLDEGAGETDAATTEMKVLTTEAPVAKLSPDAKVEDYKDEYTGENLKRVEEKGKAGVIEDFSTDQTKFYAFHKYLPKGSYIRVDFPERSQSILAEVINKTPDEDPHVVLLTAKCMDYLRMTSPGGEVTLRYVIPVGN